MLAMPQRPIEQQQLMAAQMKRQELEALSTQGPGGACASFKRTRQLHSGQSCLHNAARVRRLEEANVVMLVEGSSASS